MKNTNRAAIYLAIPKASLPFNFDYNLTHYLFYPWVVEGKKLVRLFEFEKGKFCLLKVYTASKENHLKVELYSKAKLGEKEKRWAQQMIFWMFGLNDKVSEFYDVICKKDPILSAASKKIYGAHLRRDPYVFESVIGVIVAQNVFFKRIYKMLELLCKNFGKKEQFFGKTYYTFPTPEALAKASLAEIRACAVGYRDKYIKGVAEKIVKENIDLDELRKSEDVGKIREKLIEFPGVGPYTADLAIAIGFDVPSFHLDLFTREALSTFYFKGRKVKDAQLIHFVDKRWGNWKHYAMLLLTTNTDEWAKELGVNFRLKSAAKLDKV